MNASFFAALILSLQPDPLLACVNTIRKDTTLSAERVRRNHLRPIRELKESLARDPRQDPLPLPPDSTDYSDQNNYGAALIYAGRYHDAIELLEQAEAKHPGEYSTASNMGTAYELAGQNEKALQWIQEGLRRNPDSHQGSEWVHVAILEAKIQREANPQKEGPGNVLGLPDGLLLSTKSHRVGGETRSTSAIRDGLRYQLKERLQFVKSDDWVVASLLFDYARAEAAMGTIEGARPILQMAADFGYPAVKVYGLDQYYAQVIKEARQKARAPWVLTGSLCAVAAVGLMHRKLGRGQRPAF